MPIAFLAALAGSLALHAAALFLPDVDLSMPADPPAIVVELKAPPPPAVPVPKPRPKPKHTPPPQSPAPAAQPVADVPSPVAPSSDVPVEAPPVASVPATAPAPVGETTSPAVPAGTGPNLPARGKIVFSVRRGNQGFEVGRAEHVWEFADGTYRIRAVTETSGLAALIKPVRLELESRGKLTAGGLQPEQFSTRRNGQETNENAHFDWAAHELVLGRDGSHHALQTGAQDLLSFHYQLAYLARLSDGISMQVANGRKFERYQFDAVGEERTETPAGTFRTLHVRVQTDSVTELWLALEHSLLPVKIRHTDRKGESFEQVATEIATQ